MNSLNMLEIRGLPQTDLSNSQEAIVIIEQAMARLDEVQAETNRLSMQLLEAAYAGERAKEALSYDTHAAETLAIRLRDNMKAYSKDAVDSHANIVAETALSLLTSEM